MGKKLQGTQKTGSSGEQTLGGDLATSRARKQGRPSQVKEQNPQVFASYKQTIEHFLKAFPEQISNLPDHRDQDFIYYSVPHFVYWGISLFLTHQGSLHQHGLRKGDAQFVRNFCLFTGCSESQLASEDTVIGFFKKLDPVFLEQAWFKTIQSLIRSKSLDFGKRGNRWGLAFDATGCGSSDRPYDAYCLKREHGNGTITYHRSALVAFLVLEEGFAIPIAVEFIENMEVNASKQDCEIKAFHRLAQKIKVAFPQTPIWLLADALYADQNVIRTCQKYGWGYSINLKETDLTAFWRDAQEILQLSPQNKQEIKETRPDKKTRTKTYQWVNHVEYNDLKLSAVFLEEEEWQSQEEREALNNAGQKVKTTSFSWITHQAIDRSNVVSNAQAGRQRWRCENEGFNVLKNGGFNLEHVYTRDRQGYQCFFVMMLMAHTIQQLVAKGSLLKKVIQQIGSMKNLARLLSEAFAHKVFTEPIPPVAQIRLRPDH
jgi:hypothetical protein